MFLKISQNLQENTYVKFTLLMMLQAPPANLSKIEHLWTTAFRIETTILILLQHISKFQKQPPEVLCKKSCSQKFRKVHRKTPVPETLS